MSTFLFLTIYRPTGVGTAGGHCFPPWRRSEGSFADFISLSLLQTDRQIEQAKHIKYIEI